MDKHSNSLFVVLSTVFLHRGNENTANIYVSLILQLSSRPIIRIKAVSDF